MATTNPGDARDRAPRIAVIGAGLAGAVAADRLARAGAAVTVIEKSRGPGGRAATRHRDAWRFDHGMQYFTARTEPFRRAVAAWQDAGVVATWTPRLEAAAPDSAGSLPDSAGSGGAGSGAESGGGATAGGRPRSSGGAPLSSERVTPGEWFVGIPGSNAPCRALLDASGVRFITGVRIARVDPSPRGPCLHVDRTAGTPGRAPTPPAPELVAELESEPFDAVLVTAPAPQIPELLPDAPALAASVADVRLAPCWALMLGLDRAVDVPWDVRRRADEPLAWIARESSKPGRPNRADGPGETWMIHASPGWSADHVDRDREDAAETLAAMAAEILGPDVRHPAVRMAHRWRYALVTQPADEPCIWDRASRIGLGGDWAVAGRFESAFTSGWTLAESAAESLGLGAGD
jgi:predicted NAD/FAD-dependent oxidoreductase